MDFDIIPLLARRALIPFSNEVLREARKEEGESEWAAAIFFYSLLADRKGSGWKTKEPVNGEAPPPGKFIVGISSGSYSLMYFFDIEKYWLFFNIQEVSGPPSGWKPLSPAKSFALVKTRA